MRPILDTARRIIAFLSLAHLLAPAAFAGDAGTTACFDGGPPQPVQEVRVISGQGTFEMWPAFFRPADPLGQDLPVDRDSTEYTGTEQPGFATGLELFFDLDISESGGGTYLYMAYNAGFQVWDVDGAFATAPQLLSQRDGWSGDFNSFPAFVAGQELLVRDLDAVEDPGGDTLVAVAGDAPVGLSIWDASTKTNPQQLYQDTGRAGIQVAAAVVGGTSYAFFAAGDGVHLYDMTRAAAVGPCFEDTAAAGTLCGGAGDPVWRGALGPWPWGRARYLDVFSASVLGQTKTFLAVSDETSASGLGAEIREITNAASLPPSSTSLLEGLASVTSGLDLFTVAEEGSGLDRHYLGVFNAGLLEIYDTTACLDPASVPAETCAFGAAQRKHSQQVGTVVEEANVQFSESDGRPFLYQGFHAGCSSPPAVGEANKEHLLDLTGLKVGGSVTDVLGEEYLDPNHSAPQRRVDYWSSYYDQTTEGYSAFSPQMGRFEGPYFYRAAQTLFDIHEWVSAAAEIVASSSDRWLSPAGSQEWVSLTGICSAGAGVDWSWSAANADGEPPADPNPVIEPLLGPFARVRAGLCAGDTYPTVPCPARTIDIDADVDCNGIRISAETLPLPLDDPRPFFDGIGIVEAPAQAGPPPEYPAGGVLSFQATTGAANAIAGRDPAYSWVITPVTGSGDPITCDEGSAGPGLSCTAATLSWDTGGVDVSDIFADGFESGDLAAWSLARPRKLLKGSGKTFEVKLTLTNEYASFERTTQLLLTP